MFFYADLHIHSKYSRATSKSCNLEEMAQWAQKKGLGVISTGDFTHPAWFSEIKEKLIPDGNGAYKLKPEIEKQVLISGKPVRFILSVEISTIYKKGDKTRKVHHVVFAPDIETADNFRKKLDAIGNINSDGRPILGLDSRNLLEITLNSGKDTFIIPAHIWTPWFSVLGSKSGFDSIEECYEDLSGHIFAVETGLSSDPEMNWTVSSLDKYRLVSNSDAHSPSKIAREATVFDTEANYYSILNALKTGNGYVGTVEFFPEEGKYHEDGHRKCGVCLTPEESQKLNGLCPVCKKPLTIGVLNRVNELADRKTGEFKPQTAGKVYSLVPLQEILAEICNVGAQSKKVIFEYENLIRKFGSELSILQEVPVDEIEKTHSALLAEGISRLRQGKVIKQAGYDGEYGVIRLFNEDEIVKKNFVNLNLGLEIPAGSKIMQQPLKETAEKITNMPAPQKERKEQKLEPDKYQLEAIQDTHKQLLISAGPGSGKTTVLTKRIACMIKEEALPAEYILAVTFTRKASEEMRSRLRTLLGNTADKINIHTFHSLCLKILKENYKKAGLPSDFRIITKSEKELLIKNDTEKQEGLIEFDDLINLTLKIFSEYPETLESYKNKFQYVFVDEYQDIDESQYTLIRSLVPPDGNICVIGDENQSIYGFRGGDARFFKNFCADYPCAVSKTLKNNYRSSNTIVDASNQMIHCFKTTAKKAGIHEKITIHKAPTDRAEAEFIVSTIENLIGGHSFFSLDSSRSEGEYTDYSFSDFAVLYRTSTQLAPIIEAFERSGMPYSVFSNNLLCENSEVRKILASLNDFEPLDEQLVKKGEKLESYILDFLTEIAKNNPEKTDFIRTVSLLTENDAMDSRGDRITLMTLHASKGLEFKCVFIAGLEDGILPFYRAKTDEDRQEEQRLLYVGMTRAKDRLFLSHSQKRKVFGKYQHPEISPFLAKIKSDLLKLTKYEKERKEKEKSEQLSLF